MLAIAHAAVIFAPGHFAVGIRASFELVENLIRGDEALLLWTEATKRKPGGANDRDGKGRLLPSVDNINEREERPTGTSAAAGLRRLQKEAASEDEDKAIAAKMSNVRLNHLWKTQSAPM